MLARFATRRRALTNGTTSTSVTNNSLTAVGVLKYFCTVEKAL